MLIQVTKTLIRKGKQHHPCLCPVALALKKHLHKKVEVGPKSIYHRTSGGGLASTKTPNEVKQFIEMFDRGQRVSPFTFEIIFHKIKESKW